MSVPVEQMHQNQNESVFYKPRLTVNIEKVGTYTFET